MKDKKIRITRRQKKVRSGLLGSGFRLSISRSNLYLFAQVIDQKTGKTVFGISDKKLISGAKGTKSEKAREFGKAFAAEIMKQKIKKVIFDRGAFRYHGRVKAFVEGTREAGLEY